MQADSGWPRPSYYLATALSLWLGWGIRGNYGHEYGAMIPGALAALAVCLMSGRPDWRRRAPQFACLGALGWSFGGSISYMLVVAYTHSGHSPTVLYGFACLFVIGFLWAAPGGAATALAATAPRRFLAELVLPMGLVFLLWWLQGVAIEPFFHALGYRLFLFDTDWLAATLAIIGGLATVVIRRRLDAASGLVLSMAAGWWLAFGVLVCLLDLHMTPPRGDNWAGCLGLTAGALWWLWRAGFAAAARAGVWCGLLGGIGFAAASMLKLVEVTSGLQTNWHSILEQTTGLFNGLALAAALTPVVRDAAPLPDHDGQSDPTTPLALAFVVLGITYLNLRKNVAEWVKVGSMPAEMAGLAAVGWFDVASVLVAITFVVLLARHACRPLAIVPADALGRGQLLYVALLWWLVAGNFERVLGRFAPARLVTEGVIMAVGLACTALVLGWPPPDRVIPGGSAGEAASRRRPALVLLAGLLAAALSVLADWAVVRAVWGDQFAGYASREIRFGPDATTRRAR